MNLYELSQIHQKNGNFRQVQLRRVGVLRQQHVRPRQRVLRVLLQRRENHFSIYFLSKVTPQVLNLRLYVEVFKMQKLVWLLRTISFFSSSLAVILYRRA